MTKFYKSFI